MNIYQVLFPNLQVTPECLQMQYMPDGRPSGDVLVTFLSRSEAERAISQLNKQTIGQFIIDLLVV
jgi:hypothetical protein